MIPPIRCSLAAAALALAVASGTAAQLPRPKPVLADSVPLGPGVTGATPATVDLLPRVPQTVTLTGRRLNLLTGVRVESGGRRVAVDAVLQPSSDPSRRDVRLVVQDGHRPPVGRALDLVTVYRMVAAGKAPVQVRVQPTPDLVVSDCRFLPLPTRANYRVYVTVKNVGTAPASLPGRNRLLRFNPRGGAVAPDYGGAFRMVPDGGLYLVPGAAHAFDDFGLIAAAGNQTMTFTVLQIPGVVESSEANNDRVCPIPSHPAPPPLPPPPPVAPAQMADLVVANVVVNPPSGPPSTTFVVTVTVKNQGNGKVLRARNPVVVSCTIGGDAELTDLAPGAIQIVRLSVGHSLPAGAKTTTCEVDAYRQARESDETNNTRSAAFTVN